MPNSVCSLIKWLKFIKVSLTDSAAGSMEGPQSQFGVCCIFENQQWCGLYFRNIERSCDLCTFLTQLCSGCVYHQSFIMFSTADRMQQEVWRMSEELRQQTEAMVLKDGCISLLRDRLRTVRKCGL
jgi:hypothetical protein